MAKKFNINSFLNLSPEEQAKSIEKETRELIKRLPTLKKQLKMYGEVSDELYNLSEEEVSLMGTTYARAVRSGEITTPSSKRAYNSFIRNLRKYSRTNIGQLALKTAEERLDSFKETIMKNGSDAEKEYVTKLLNSMSDKQKLGFTRSEYFLDVENWNSEGFVQDTEMGQMSISTLKLELYLETYEDNQTDGLYNKDVATDGEVKLRGAYRGRKARKRR